LRNINTIPERTPQKHVRQAKNVMPVPAKPKQRKKE
jgi:hypothetical protein